MYTPLYIKTNYSLLSSLISVPKLIEIASLNHLKAVAITDSNMFGVMEFISGCSKAKLKPVIGLEVVVDNISILLYAKNYIGYKHLMKLSTIQSAKKLELTELSSLISDLIVVLPYKSKDFYSELTPFTKEIYLGYETLTEEREAYVITKNVIYLPKVLYLKETEQIYLPYLEMIRDGKTIGDDIPAITGNHHFQINNLERYTDNTGLLNIETLISSCNIIFPKPELLLPIYDTEGVPVSKYLFQLSRAGLTKRLQGNISDKYKERLLYELSVIDKMGFSNYFLVVYDFVKYAKQNGILVGPGRGSAAGSLVAYSLGITEIDPLTYNLLFERFLNPERVTMPDIDTDFPDIYRNQVIDYVVNKYGIKKVAGIVTFGTLGAKQAIRDVSRVLNIPLYKVDTLCKYIPQVSSLTLKELYKKNDKFKLMIDEDDTLIKMFKIASFIEGFPRHTSSHAAGIVMSSVEIDEVVPLTKSDDMYLTSYSMEYLEDLGLLKMDFLGIKNLTTIMNIIESIKEIEGIDIDFNKIPLDDRDTLNIFKEANTSGIFQFESVGMRNFLRNLKAESFEDIFAAIALFRPGPAVNIDSYIRRKNHEEEIEYLDPSLKSILEPTKGIIIYQEQIMQIAATLAGYTLGEADILRRAMSKKKMDILKKEEEKFISQSIARGYKEDTTKKIFDLILNFANYGFNRSHSVAYALVAYKMAYLKAHFTKHFFASLFSCVIGSETKTKEYLGEAKANSIKLLKPDINQSSDKYKVVKEGILYPLANIRHIGVVTSDDIIKNRKTPYLDIFDFVARVSSRSLTRKTLETLVDASVFDFFGLNHATIYYNMDAILNYAELASNLDTSLIIKPELEIVKEFGKEELMLREKEAFGFYLSNHPASVEREKYKECVPLEHVKDYFNKTVETITLIDKIKVIDTKKGDKMAFLVGSDETGSMDYTLFPKTYNIYKDLELGKLIKVVGVVEKRLDRYQIIVRELIIL
ncbi:MAG: DNA polymerase III subunit alpha [Bacilli bacterium]